MGHVPVHKIGPPPFPLTPDFLAALRHQGEVYREHHDGALPPTRDWEYLERRYAIDPARFIHWHPVIGEWIKHIPPPPIVVPPVDEPPTGPQTIEPPPGGSGGGTTPGGAAEPAGWVLLGVAMGIVFVYLAFRGARK